MILGMICKKLGAESVTLSDHDEISIKHMKEDLIRNEIEANVIHLDWYNPIIDLDVNKFQNLVIVAGDVLYKHSLLCNWFYATVWILSV